MPGQHLKGKICGQAIRRDMVDEIKSCSESKFMVRALDFFDKPRCYCIFYDSNI